MIINFKSMEEKKIVRFKDGTGVFCVKMFDNHLGKIMHGKLEKGASIGYHTHETNSEIIYILEGTGVVLYDDGKEIVEAGQCHYCPKGHSHSLRNESESDLYFFAVVPEQ